MTGVRMVKPTRAPSLRGSGSETPEIAERLIAMGWLRRASVTSQSALGLLSKYQAAQ